MTIQEIEQAIMNSLAEFGRLTFDSRALANQAAETERKLGKLLEQLATARAAQPKPEAALAPVTAEVASA